MKDVDAIRCATEPLINWKNQSAAINKHKNPRGAELLEPHIGEELLIGPKCYTDQNL